MKEPENNNPDPFLTKSIQELEIPEGDDIRNWDSLLIAIQRQVAFMLKNQTERLMQILYRLDVQESKVKMVFQQETPDKWAGKIAILIVQREKQRQMWRNHYASSQPE